MWVLALGGAFLAVAKACIFCRLQDHALANRLAQLNNQTKPKWKWKEWASPDFSAFALDEVSMKQVTEKTHRVLRVIALCAPVCRGSTILYNCSTCEGKEESCWPQKHCYPDSHDLWDARILLLCIFGIVLLSGVVSLQVEYLKLQAKDL